MVCDSQRDTFIPKLNIINNRALGCTMYAMAFRNSPFDGSMTAAVGGKVTFPSGPNPYGEHFKGLLQWIIVADPAARPDVLAVRQRIEALLAGIDFEV